jgi:hypothetical protein
MTTGIVQTESRHAGGFMVSEAEGRRSRVQGVVALSRRWLPARWSARPR